MKKYYFAILCISIAIIYIIVNKISSPKNLTDVIIVLDDLNKDSLTELVDDFSDYPGIDYIENEMSTNTIVLKVDPNVNESTLNEIINDRDLGIVQLDARKAIDN